MIQVDCVTGCVCLNLTLMKFDANTENLILSKENCPINVHCHRARSNNLETMFLNLYST